MIKKISWGILGCSEFVKNNIIPAMLKGKYSVLSAVSSESKSKALKTASLFNIPKYYSGFDALLEDKDINAVYIPLPNHLHTEWTKKAAAMGKHVLCEKPIALSIHEINDLISTQKQYKVLISEAFMIRSHPQWKLIKEIVKNGEIGKLSSIQGHFSYFFEPPGNLSKPVESGGGVFWDIGCYFVHVSRFLADSEPLSVSAVSNQDPVHLYNSITSGILDFSSFHSTFTVSSSAVNSQSVIIYGSKAKLIVDLPFNPQAGKTASIRITDNGESRKKELNRVIFTEKCNQYTLQADNISQAIIKNSSAPVSLTDSLHNTAVMLAVIKAAEQGISVNPSELL